MRRVSVITVAAVVLFLAGGAAAVWVVNKPPSVESASNKPELSHPQLAPATSLALSDLLDSGPKLKPSAKAEALNGKRVHVVGFMAEMEEPIEGAFYLVPRPISLDESGGGTGDLPPNSILVMVPGSEGRAIAVTASAR
jgi:hypothetical protein